MNTTAIFILDALFALLLVLLWVLVRLDMRRKAELAEQRRDRALAWLNGSKSLPALVMLASSLAAQSWCSGDSHVHQQTCSGPDLTLADIGAAASSSGLNFVALQLWARFGNVPEYLSLAHLIDGTEPLPGSRYGLEVSGFAASQFGHLQILDADTGDFPWQSLYPAPIFAHYDDALCGYAHVRWNENYAPVPFFGGVGGAYMAPIDAALRSIDFIETMEVEWDTPTTWRGMYYKLQSAGLRVGLAAGSDDTCGSQDGIGNPRTWAVAATYDEWCDEIRAGRTTISDDGDFRVELDVGAQLTATLRGLPQTGTLTILANGQAIASLPYATAGEDVVLTAPPPSSSAWVAARAFGAHTAAQYVIVGDEPVAVAQDAAYWVAYCEAFEANIGAFNVPSVEPEILARIGLARDIYAATLQRVSPWPRWAVEYGLSTPACDGPISIGLTAAGKLDCLGAPSNAIGWLVLGTAPASIQTNGITLLVAPLVVLPATANSGGYAVSSFTLPAGKQLHAQFVWPGDCGVALAASDAIDALMP